MRNLDIDLDNILDDAREGYLENLKMQQEKLEKALQKVKDEIERFPKKPSNTANSYPKKESTFDNSKKEKPKDNIKQLVNSTGGEAFLYGLKKLGGEATISEVADEMASLRLEHNIKRTEKQFRQWLTVSADYLADKKKKILKEDRNDRIGGKLYKLKE